MAQDKYNAWQRLNIYTKRNTAKIAGYLSGLTLWLHHIVDDKTLDLVLIPSILVLVIMGEITQRTEDSKTIHALYSDAPSGVSDDVVIDHICYNNTTYKRAK